MADTKPTGIQEEKKDAKLISTEDKAAEGEKPAAEKPKAPAKPAERTKEEKAESFKFIRGYAGRECGSIVLGIIFLVGGSLSDLAVPLFIG